MASRVQLDWIHTDSAQSDDTSYLQLKLTANSPYTR